MKLDKCPKCGWNKIDIRRGKSTVFKETYLGHSLHYNEAIALERKVQVECGRVHCDQLLWFYPATGKVTERSE